MPSKVDVRIARGELPEYAQRAFDDMARTDAHRRALEAEIYARRVAAYEAEARRQMEIFRLPDREIIHPRTSEVTRQIRRDARRDARSITNTYNRDLARMMNRQIGPGVNQTTLGFRGQRWSNARRDWKARQVGISNTTGELSRAQRGFIQENPELVATTLWEVVPFSAAEPICAGYIGGNPHTTEEIEALTLPAHVNCIHYRRPLVGVPGRVPFKEDDA